nr:CPBP family intramembrane glutamic endopeptidase [Nocardioides thalensis]
MHRLGRQGIGWSALALFVTVVVGYVAANVVVLAVAVVADLAGTTVETDPVTPAGLTALNLVWAVAIPVTWLALFAGHGLRPGWLASVVGRVRWRWLVVCLGLSLVALVATIVVSMFFPQQPGAEVSGELNDWSARTRDFVLVIVLLTPLQAAGEEFAFRGYLTQAFGGLVGGRLAAPVAVAVPALLFALAHGAQSAPVFVDRLAFGLVAGALTILTGGLEAGIAMHVLNNWTAFGLALAFGDLDASLTPDGGTWWTLPGTLTQSFVFLGLVLWSARRRGVETAWEGGVLEGPGSRR